MHISHEVVNLMYTQDASSRVVITKFHIYPCPNYNNTSIILIFADRATLERTRNV